jgi:hypothetical protein
MPSRSPPRPRRARPRLEVLETRWLPSVTLGTGFNGLAFGDTAGYVPPDTIAAAGPTNIVEAVNTTLAIFDKSGNKLSSQSLQSFFSSVGTSGNLSDPFVSYDEQAGRFVVGVLDFGYNYLDLAVSNTSDPTQGFAEKDRISLREGSFFSAVSADYPRFGYNGDAYAISFNMFNSFFGYYDHTQVVVVKKSSVLDATPGVSGFRVDRSGSSNFTLTPAVMHGGGNGLMWFVEEAGYGNGQKLDAVKLNYTWTSTGVTGVKFTDNIITLPSAAFYGEPPAASQPGGGEIENNDARILNVAWSNNRLVAAQTVGESDGLAHARFYEISTLSTPALTQWADVTPGVAGADTYYPSVEINPAGELGMTFMESSPTEYVAMYVTAQTSPNPAPGTLQGSPSAPVRAQAGLANYNAFDGSPHRAGDFSGISVDPVDGSFWAANEYATSRSTNNWGTFIQHFTDPPGGSTERHSAPVAFSGVAQWPPPADYPVRLGGTEFQAPLQDFLLDHPALYRLLVSISQQLYDLHAHRAEAFFVG